MTAMGVNKRSLLLVVGVGRVPSEGADAFLACKRRAPGGGRTVLLNGGWFYSFKPTHPGFYYLLLIERLCICCRRSLTGDKIASM